MTQLSVTKKKVQATSMRWQKQDTVWMLSLYGTAIGAGTLFLPITAGIKGIWTLLMMVVLAFPLTHYSHRALCRFVLSGQSPTATISSVVAEHFGPFAGNLLTFLYFIAIYPIVLIYSVALTNTSQSFLMNQIGIVPPSRSVLSLLLILVLIFVIRLGHHFIVTVMSILVYPFSIVLIGLSFYLMPYWNTSIFVNSMTITSKDQWLNLLSNLWLSLPVLIFSFNHSPLISTFAVNQKARFNLNADIKSRTILKYSHILMVVTVMFFVLSSVFSLSPLDLLRAKQENLSILSYLANHFNNPIIANVAPVVAFIAISKSFLGHYVGASEGLFGLFVKILPVKIKQKKANLIIDTLMVVSCWVVAIENPSILGLIETLVGPIIALLLFLMPMYAIIKVPSMKKYQHKSKDLFIITTGILAIFALFYRS